MEREQNAKKVKRTQKDYSLAFKLQVVDEVEKGYLTYKQAQRRYGIQGRATVLVWLRKHGRKNWDKGNIMKKEFTPYEEIRQLKKQIKILKAEKEILNMTIDEAEKMFELSIRKKFLPLSFAEYKRQRKEKED